MFLEKRIKAFKYFAIEWIQVFGERDLKVSFNRLMLEVNPRLPSVKNH